MIKCPTIILTFFSFPLLSLLYILPFLSSLLFFVLFMRGEERRGEIGERREERVESKERRGEERRGKERPKEKREEERRIEGQENCNNDNSANKAKQS